MSENKNQPLLEVKNLKEYFNISMGMFKTKPLKAVDDVSFSTELPPPEPGTASVRITKTIVGLEEADARALLDQLEFQGSDDFTGMLTGNNFVNFRRNDDGSYSADCNFPGRMVGASGWITFTMTELLETADYGSYRRMTTVSTQTGGAAQTQPTEGDTGSVRIAEGNSGAIEFTNTYARAEVDMRIYKQDALGNSLSNAEFEVTDCEEETSAVYGTDSEYGAGYTNAIFLPLDQLYCLQETKVPAGYTGLPGRVFFKVQEVDSVLSVWFCDENGTPLSEDPTDVTAAIAADGTQIIKVTNHPGVCLPETGGIGTVPYAVIGILLIAVSLMYGMIKRREVERRKEG